MSPSLMPQQEEARPNRQHQEQRWRSRTTPCFVPAAAGSCWPSQVRTEAGPGRQLRVKAAKIHPVPGPMQVALLPSKLLLARAGTAPTMLLRVPVKTGRCENDCEAAVPDQVLQHPEPEVLSPCKKFREAAAENQVPQSQQLMAADRCKPRRAEAARSQLRQSSMLTKKNQCSLHLAEATKNQNQRAQVPAAKGPNLSLPLPTKWDQAKP